MHHPSQTERAIFLHGDGDSARARPRVTSLVFARLVKLLTEPSPLDFDPLANERLLAEIGQLENFESNFLSFPPIRQRTREREREPFRGIIVTRVSYHPVS